MSDAGNGFPPPPQGGQGPAPQDGGWQPVNAGPPPTGYVPPSTPPPGYVPPPYGQPLAGMSSTTAAAVSYLTFIPAIVMLVIDPYRRDGYVRFHAWQSIVLSGVSLVGGWVLQEMGRMGMHFLLGAIHAFFHIVLFVFWLIAIIKASQGERYHIPIVGDIAENLNASVQI